MPTGSVEFSLHTLWCFAQPVLDFFEVEITKDGTQCMCL